MLPYLHAGTHITITHSHTPQETHAQGKWLGALKPKSYSLLEGNWIIKTCIIQILHIITVHVHSLILNEIFVAVPVMSKFSLLKPWKIKFATCKITFWIKSWLKRAHLHIFKNKTIHTCIHDFMETEGWHNTRFLIILPIKFVKISGPYQGLRKPNTSFQKLMGLSPWYWWNRNLRQLYNRLGEKEKKR